MAEPAELRETPPPVLVLGFGAEVKKIALVRESLERNDPEERKFAFQLAERVVHDVDPVLDLGLVEISELARDERHVVAQIQVAPEVRHDLAQIGKVVRIPSLGVVFPLMPQYCDDLAALPRGPGHADRVVVSQ